jgi:predicted helicase
MKSFDSIYIYDLHGNAKKKEVCPNGSKDENVFDIMQGVNIIFAIKSDKPERKHTTAEIYHYESWGKREMKYQALEKADFTQMKRTKLSPKNPYYFFVPKDFGLEKEYKKGIAIDELFCQYSSGIETQKDEIAIQKTQEGIERVKQDFLSLPVEQLKEKYKVTEGRDWTFTTAKKDVVEHKPSATPILYRPFYMRRTLYT